MWLLMQLVWLHLALSTDASVSNFVSADYPRIPRPIGLAICLHSPSSVFMELQILQRWGSGPKSRTGCRWPSIHGPKIELNPPEQLYCLLSLISLETRLGSFLDHLCTTPCSRIVSCDLHCQRLSNCHSIWLPTAGSPDLLRSGSSRWDFILITCN